MIQLETMLYHFAWTKGLHMDLKDVHKHASPVPASKLMQRINLPWLYQKF